MANEANAAEYRAFNGVVGGVLLGAAGGMLNSFLDDGIALFRDPTSLDWFRLMARGGLVLTFAIPGLFLAAAAWPTPASNGRPIWIASALVGLLAVSVGGFLFANGKPPGGGDYQVANGASQVTRHVALAQSGSETISAEAQGWWYRIPVDVPWQSADGGWHDGGRPACLPPGTQAPISFGSMDVRVGTVSTRQVVWVSCAR